MVTKDIIRKAAFETLSIVIAVFIALWAENWWADKQSQQLADKMLISVEKELSSNLTKALKSHKHHSDQIKMVKQYLNSHSTMDENSYKELSVKLFRKGVFKPAEQYKTNWQIIKNKGLVSDISEKRLRLIIPAYAAISRYEEGFKNIGRNGMLVDLLAKTEELKLNITFGNLSEIWWKERYLIKQLEKAIGKTNTDEEN